MLKRAVEQLTLQNEGLASALTARTKLVEAGPLAPSLHHPRRTPMFVLHHTEEQRYLQQTSLEMLEDLWLTGDAGATVFAPASAGTARFGGAAVGRDAVFAGCGLLSKRKQCCTWRLSRHGKSSWSTWPCSSVPRLSSGPFGRCKVELLHILIARALHC